MLSRNQNAVLNPEITFFSYSDGHLADDMIRFIQTKSFLHLNTDIFMTPVIDLSSSNFERVVKDRTRSIMVMYYNGNCDLCNSLQNTIHDVGITFRNEPTCLIGRLNCDTEPQICIEQTIPHYPTFKVYSQHNKDGVVYEPGAYQESYSERNMTTFMNALCGTQREMRGRLNEKVSFDTLKLRSNQTSSSVRKSCVRTMICHAVFTQLNKLLRLNLKEDRMRREKDLFKKNASILSSVKIIEFF